MIQVLSEKLHNITVFLKYKTNRIITKSKLETLTELNNLKK